MNKPTANPRQTRGLAHRLSRIDGTGEARPYESPFRCRVWAVRQRAPAVSLGRATSSASNEADPQTALRAVSPVGFERRTTDSDAFSPDRNSAQVPALLRGGRPSARSTKPGQGPTTQARDCTNRAPPVVAAVRQSGGFCAASFPPVRLTGTTTEVAKAPRSQTLSLESVTGSDPLGEQLTFGPCRSTAQHGQGPELGTAW